MTPEITILIISAATIAFVHTILGPDHYLPFVAMSKARSWSLAKTLNITLICGIGHIAGSIILGMGGIYLGSELSRLVWFEGVRGDIAAWLLVAFGLLYMVWGIRKAYLNKPHSHWHSHGSESHSHEHTHKQDHAHVHENSKTNITPWVIFIIFVLGPCEPLIPLLMYPAARESAFGVVMVATVFGIVTMLTMLLAVFVAALGLKAIDLSRFERFGHAIAGSTVLLCGLGVVFLGL